LEKGASRACAAKRSGGAGSYGFSSGGEPEFGLFQGGEICPEIDVIRLTVDDKGGNGFYARGFRLGDPALRLTEVNDLDFILFWIETFGEPTLGVDADRASRVIENRFARHDVLLLFSFASFQRAAAFSNEPPFSSTRPKAR
jgi:hypothetical protein